MSVGFSTTTRGRIEVRDARLCVVCGMPGYEKHHRRRRRVNWDGLAHSPANGITMCGWGNNLGCHGRAHRQVEWAKERGLIVLPEQSPVEVPLLHVVHGLILLNDDGGWEPAERSA